MAEPRHEWMAGAAAATLSCEASALLPLMKTAATTAFLDGSGPARLFIAASAAGYVAHDGSDPAGLSLTPETYMAYFTRTVDGAHAVKLSVESDADILSGEMDSNVLSAIVATLSGSSRPFATAVGTIGKVEQNHVDDYLHSLDRFVDECSETLKSMAHASVRLPQPETEIDIKAATNRKGKINSDVAAKAGGVLKEWIEKINAYIDAAGETPTHPLEELERWRARVAALTHVQEQLKLRTARSVLQLLAKHQPSYALLQEWKRCDLRLTEAYNEAKDNLKYVLTLEKYLSPLYELEPLAILETLPVLMNAAKLVFSIARHYNSQTTMGVMLSTISNQIISACTAYLLDGGKPGDVWGMPPDALALKLAECSRLKEGYVRLYEEVGKQVEALPHSSKFEFDEIELFGRLNLFGRRILKLEELFTIVHQFTSLKGSNLENVERIVDEFAGISNDFKKGQKNVLDFTHSSFDRDFVQFSAMVDTLETHTIEYISDSFDMVTTIGHQLDLLGKFQKVFTRDRLRLTLNARLVSIFVSYGGEIEAVKQLYEKEKQSPPLARNLPPVVGNIAWSRLLLQRVEHPMRRFEENPVVLSSPNAKRIVKSYNKLVRTLVAFEYLWFRAWCNAMDAAQAGLAATLIVRHPDDSQLYVNFDLDIFQLLREARCLERLGLDIPDSARTLLVQETKFKGLYERLRSLLVDYDRVVSSVIPVTSVLLRPAFRDMELALRPGMIVLTWTSMNIEPFVQAVEHRLARISTLVFTVNDIIETRIENQLAYVSKLSLVDLPAGRSFTQQEFLDMQEEHSAYPMKNLAQKNQEVKHATNHLIATVVQYTVDDRIAPVDDETITKINKHYNHFLYQSLLHSAKSSLTALKDRISKRATPADEGEAPPTPFFEVAAELTGKTIGLSPDLAEIQDTVNGAVRTALKSLRKVYDWGQEDIQPAASRVTFYDHVTSDIEIAKVVLVLNGGVQAAGALSRAFLKRFEAYDWIWKADMEEAYSKFMEQKPNLEDYRAELQKFDGVMKLIEEIPEKSPAACCMLNTGQLREQIGQRVDGWKLRYAKNLQESSAAEMNDLVEYMAMMEKKLSKDVHDLDSLRFIMAILEELRLKEQPMLHQIDRLLHTFAMLAEYLPDGFMSKEEMDNKAVLFVNNKKMMDHSEDRTQELADVQGTFKRRLLIDVQIFKQDVVQFRKDFLSGGPMQAGIGAEPGLEKMQRFREGLTFRRRKYDLYSGGEALFKLPHTDYPDLETTTKEITLNDTLYTLYTDVRDSIAEWNDWQWKDVVENIEEMTTKMEGFAGRCKRVTKRLRELEAYLQVKKQSEDLLVVLPIFQELSKESIAPRHWQQLIKLSGGDPPEDDAMEEWLNDVTLRELIEMNLPKVADDILEITDMADKEKKIELGLEETVDKWEVERLSFQPWKDRGTPTLFGFNTVLDELEEAVMTVQTMLTMKAVAPFKEITQDTLAYLSDAAETLDLWIKVQMLWCSLESVFTGGDISKQMPVEAKKFAKVDKDFVANMDKADKTQLVLECCQNDTLKAVLPAMISELEKCSRALADYMDQKRMKFPRFYFVSDTVLLDILSQSSDPESLNRIGYLKVFDSIENVGHDKKDKSMIISLFGNIGETQFLHPVKAAGNVEDWLNVLLQEMRLTLKEVCRVSATEIINGPGRTSNGELLIFVDRYMAQFALLGIQLLWTDIQERALEGMRNKKVAVDAAKSQAEILKWMSGWCLTDLGSKYNRKKIETLVTVHVHQRDVSYDLLDLIKKNKLKGGLNDFEWSKQARFYWRDRGIPDDTSEQGAMVIQVTDVDFYYQYEYFAAKERLVITPLTDRCYITLAQALGMSFGGAPAGPAGTGKTETTKDMGATLGIFVMVTNCGDQMRYTDCAKIFKGLCQAGIWGCFDEFNRIVLPVLSVVAQQVLAIQNAKKTNQTHLTFPGDPANIRLNPNVGYFITMNPGYPGRQSLPENLKALFRGVMMMVPNFQIIKAVKLCSQGYDDYEALAKKFFILYETCKQQLSNQRHYDWGLRNILAVLRTCGSAKRKHLRPDGTLTQPEPYLIYQTLRDMNLSKLVSQDVPLFLSLLADLFPALSPPGKASYPGVFAELPKQIDKHEFVRHEDWILKCIQLFETTNVRHGIMLVGPTDGGKSAIFDCLIDTLKIVNDETYVMKRMNPKAVLAKQMYGQSDPVSGEWIKGVFAQIWAKANAKGNKFITWIIMDGPVDAIWIEDLNTVLDDNKILTLANGDRFPMSEMCKIMFEVETLKNASPATVSRAGIIYVSNTDLDWEAVSEGIIRKRPEPHRDVLRALFGKYFGHCLPINPGPLFDFFNRNLKKVMETERPPCIVALFNLMGGLLDESADGEAPPVVMSDATTQLEMVFLYCVAWAVGGLLDDADRTKFDLWLRKRAGGAMPKCEGTETIYEYFLSQECEWKLWKPPKWEYPSGDKLDFSNLLVPTMDSTRALFLIRCLHKNSNPVLLVGGAGTAKTSTVLMYCATLDKATVINQRLNFSSATSPNMFQDSIEANLEKRGGRNYGPPPGKTMTVFLDDLSMPEVNSWGDQITNEMVRILVEQSGFPFLDKDKRGEWKVVDDLKYIAAMGIPGGGANDIPNRLKSRFFFFNLVLPSIVSINDIYGQMLGGAFPASKFDGDTMEIAGKLTKATITLWNRLQQKMLPTPAKFHYIFNLRDLSRVFQGILGMPQSTILEGGGYGVTAGVLNCEPKMVEHNPPHMILLKVWQHECDRVFEDKLTNHKDKGMYQGYLADITLEDFGEEAATDCKDNPANMVNFLREDVFDEDDILVEKAPKVYECGGTKAQVRQRAEAFLAKHNEENPQVAMNLVLFADAMGHLMRISRILEMPRGSAMLVGVGGSGKQSLTKLASYISRSFTFQIQLTKTYGVATLMEDLKMMYKVAGHKREQVTFLFTDAEVKDENFLEYLNSVLLTGEVAGLIAKDEQLAINSDLTGVLKKERPDQEETQDNLRQLFIDGVRDNLHIVLCFSPLNPLFPVRARKFPGVFAVPTIDYFLPWPEEALIEVSHGLIAPFPLECTPDEKQKLIVHMGTAHKLVTEVCDEYKTKMGRQVYQTPKSFLSFIDMYMGLYAKKLAVLKKSETSLNLGLEKLVQGAADVEAMKIVMAEEQKKVDIADAECQEMLVGLEKSKAEANKIGEEANAIKTACLAEAARIAGVKEGCEVEVAAAQPFVDTANAAIASVQKKDVQEISANKKPTPIIQCIFDGILLLFQLPMLPVKVCTHVIAKADTQFIESSFFLSGQTMLARGIFNDPNSSGGFLGDLQGFGAEGGGKDFMNEECVEFLCPYIELENEKGPAFTPEIAKSASGAAMGLCILVTAMKSYYYAARTLRPKLEELGVAMNQLDEANAKLAKAESDLAACEAELQRLQDMFDNQMAQKKRIEDGAAALAKKAKQASDLIGGLSGEQKRWGEDSAQMADLKRRLTGDSAVGAAFVSYCGPFNQEFRAYMIEKKFIGDCIGRGVPVTEFLDIISFLVDAAEIADWNVGGLPTDPLSIQNGILITQASRFPLLIDPQGQAISWFMTKEKDKLPNFGTTTLKNSKLRDQLEFAMGEGQAFIVVAVEEELDPMFDPLLEKQFIKRGNKKFLNISDKMMEYHPNFIAYFITRLPNPRLSPELQAKTCVIDFTVTQLGLEEQLLGKVIGKEQRALEEQLEAVMSEASSNTKALQMLNDSLLDRLTSNTGNLLEDEELIDVLATTKTKAAEVTIKLANAAETKKNINEKREQFRPVATRGAVLYFAIVDLFSVNTMYQTSLDQFVGLFMSSMDVAEPAALTQKRVANIISAETYLIYRYINRALYVQDKQTFLMLVSTRTLITAGLLTNQDIGLFLRGGAAVDRATAPKKPFRWISSEDTWLNLVELSRSCKPFKELLTDMARNESVWQRWFEDDEPDKLPIPDYEDALMERDIGPFLKMLLVRSMRIDRTTIVANEFLEKTATVKVNGTDLPVMGPAYTQPVSDTIPSIYDESVPTTPTIFLLSKGADPTDDIQKLARKMKLPMPSSVSLGEGQEPVAIKAMQAGATNGTWVLLQNCELGMGLMNEAVEILEKIKQGGIDPGFRLFLTCMPDPNFPLSLLQISTKVACEAPAGLKAAMLNTYTTLVDQDRLERIEGPKWRTLLYSLAFLHSIVTERRKFGYIGWCIAYEFGASDLIACMLFLEKHMYTSAEISWPTCQYMISQIQYGGKVSDLIDRRTFDYNAEYFFKPSLLDEDFSYTPYGTYSPIKPFADDFNYNIPVFAEIKQYHAWFNTFPESDSPEIYGLHPNADLTYRMNAATQLISVVAGTQPKGGGGGGGGMSREEQVTMLATNLEGQLPEYYLPDDYKAKINKLGGLSVPLNIFLFQEIERLQDVLARCGSMLAAMKLAIKGEVVMTDDLAEAVDAFAEARPPKTWVYTVTGDEFSWIVPVLGLWFSQLLQRDQQNRTWLNNGRPFAYWLTGFSNPQGYMTAVKQEVTRRYKSNGWGLDDMVYHTEAQPMANFEAVRGPAPEGCYVYGLSMDGATYNLKNLILEESAPKVMFTLMPVVLISAAHYKEAIKINKNIFGAHGPYEAAVYKYFGRTFSPPFENAWRVGTFNLRCPPEKPAVWWGLRGLALLMNTT